MTTLRHIELLGPKVLVGGQAAPQPLWTLHATSPHFRRQDVDPPSTRTHADHAHPMRVLSMYAQAVRDDPASWRRPRLIDVHLVAGAIGGSYEFPPGDDIALNIPFTTGVRHTPFRWVRTFGEPSAADHTPPPFARVVAEPVIEGSEPWPESKNPNIVVPRLRIVSGRVPLWVNASQNVSKLTWLKNLGVIQDDDGWCQIWLTPDGIEFDATLPFPGRAPDEKLEARVLLAEAPDRRGNTAGEVSMTLTYLGATGEQSDHDRASAEDVSRAYETRRAVRETHRAAWLAVWRAITPQGMGEDAQVGLKFAARRDGDVPGFRWTVDIDAGRPVGLLDSIEVPGEALRIELVSPPVNGAIDGTARVRSNWVHVEGNTASVTFHAMTRSADRPPKHPIQIQMTGGAEKELSVSTKAFHAEIDVRRLAADLRAAYRLPTPQVDKAQRIEEGSAGTVVERERPLLPAFVAVAPGWLQLPIPNLAPLDPGNDLDLAVSVEISPRSVLEGFVRFRAVGSAAAVLSGHQPQVVARAELAPWSFTIERATHATLDIVLTPGETQATLSGFSAVLDGAKVSARGLLWVSSDQPDALDALPRLSAGPGAHMDLPLEAMSTQRPETADGMPRPLLMAIDAKDVEMRAGLEMSSRIDNASLALRFTVDHDDWVQRLSTDQARAALKADRKIVLGDESDSKAPWRPVLWRRRGIPSVATMPMTRIASASVRPLESRELMPYVMTAGSGSNPPLAEFIVGGARVFPELVTRNVELQPLPGWPLPGKIADTESGIGFAAVGLPGVEVCPLTSPGDADNLTAAVHYDLPLQDEAFATAPLPPVPKDDTPSELMTPPPRPITTTIDWPLMQDFWDAQNRTHQNARVRDSYLSPFLSIDTDKPHSVKVRNLIDGLTWTTSVHIQTQDLAQPLPYGRLVLGQKTMSGYAALEDHDRDFDVDVAKATLTEGNGDIKVVGFSPPTFREKEDGMLLDNQRVGAGVAEISATNDALLTRPVTLPGQAAGARLVSLLQPMNVQVSGPDAASITLAFWFKDVLIDRTGKAQLPAEGQPFQIWSKADDLAAGGFEWRLAPVDQPFAEAAFRQGRGVFGLFGYLLEPLRLTSLNVKNDLVSEASIECRLTLGPRQEVAKGNVVVLTLTQIADGTSCSFGNSSVEFPLQTRDHGRERAMRFSATLAGGLAFKLTDMKLELMIAERWITLSKGVTTRFERIEGHGLWVDRLLLSASTEVPDAKKVQALVYVPLVEIELHQVHKRDGEVTVRIDELPAIRTLDRTIMIYPQPVSPGTAAPPMALRILASTIDFFGIDLACPGMQWKEGDGVLQVEGSNDDLKGRGTLFSDVSGRLAFGMLARADSVGASHLVLSAGHLEADFRQKNSQEPAKPELLRGTHLRLTVATPAFDARDAQAVQRWTGRIEVTTRVSATNCIEWRELDWPEAAESIPVPGDQANARVRISAKADGRTARHSVEWIIAGHRLPFQLAAAIAKRAPDAVWTAPVWTRHTLERGDRTLHWSGVDAIGFGASEAVVPRFTSYEDEARTFAARYANSIDALGQYGDLEPGMDRAGCGALAKVLHGLLGAAFRRHFWKKDAKQPRWLLAGGHLGVLGLDRRGDTGVLVRLPVLVGSAEKFPQSFPDTGLEINWADGPASRRVARSRPNSTTPASAAYDAILAALRSVDRDATEAEIDELIAALVVDQAMRYPEPGESSTAPHFVASAIDVERLQRFAAQGEAGATVTLSSLSLVAVDLRRGSAWVSRAAAIRMRDGAARIPLVVRGSRVVTLGQHVTEDAWRGRIEGEAGLTKPLYGIAVGRHAAPLGAMVIDEQPGRTNFLVAMFPGSRAIADAKTAEFRDGFADHGRGPLAAPSEGGDDDHWRWLLPPIEGMTTPVRDVANPADARRSGLAGLSSRVALAAHAGKEVSLSNADADPDLVWISQTHVPIYLPLKMTDMHGPPLGWLTPAPSRVRLPVATEVLTALAPPEDGKQQLGRVVQPFLPPTLTTTSLSERAGIRTARRMRLLGALRNGIDAFDAEIARFGRPAQAGSSFARTMRTPRPGRLPANLDDPARDRRVQANGLRHASGCDAFIGAADALEGRYGDIGRWAIALVAAPEWESVISDRWDGSIRLTCRVSLKQNPPKPKAPGEPPLSLPSASALLKAALFPLIGASGKPWARAALKIGDARVDYGWLQITGDPCWHRDADVLRADLSLLLDVYTDDLPRPETAPPWPAIVDALSTRGPLPPVELQLTLRPSNAAGESTIDARGFALDKNTGSALTPGSDRAPLTLRFPLYPVTAQRGALPLTPATLLFRDRAYDRDLAGPPHEDARMAIAPSNLQAGRGGLRVVLAVDRASVNRRGTLAVLADVRYERPMSDLQQWKAEQKKDGVGAGGDLLLVQPAGQARPTLAVAVQSRDGKERNLRMPEKSVDLAWGLIHELALTQLLEEDGQPARLTAGDMLMFDMAVAAKAGVKLWNSIGESSTDVNVDDKVVGRNLRVMLTDDPVVEPPPALYLALLRTLDAGGKSHLSVPLHAQSPLPLRVDLVDPLRDFRKGMIRREAAFVWTLLRPARDFREKALTVVKCDRNGQLYLPEEVDEFAQPERLFRSSIQIECSLGGGVVRYLLQRDKSWRNVTDALDAGAWEEDPQRILLTATRVGPLELNACAFDNCAEGDEGKAVAGMTAGKWKVVGTTY